MARIVVLSDIHLSPTHGFFWENWCVARESADAAKADAVIVNGDLAINGPDSEAEIAFAATTLGYLRTRVMALPGNHDVGDEPPGQDADQIIDADRLARWDNSFATDRWALDAGGWRLIGVNAQLFGPCLAREHAQEQWLDAQLCTAGLAHRAVPAQASLPRKSNRRCLESRVHGAVGSDATARQARSVRRASNRQRSPASTS
jgi:3',5'-cyclic AMP phosphodiesterase CpdA